jgi:hypothetical protein
MKGGFWSRPDPPPKLYLTRWRLTGARTRTTCRPNRPPDDFAPPLLPAAPTPFLPPRGREGRTDACTLPLDLTVPRTAQAPLECRGCLDPVQACPDALGGPPGLGCTPCPPGRWHPPSEGSRSCLPGAFARPPAQGQPPLEFLSWNKLTAPSPRPPGLGGGSITRTDRDWFPCWGPRAPPG